MYCEYSEDILTYLYEIEKNRIRSDYKSLQVLIRESLVDLVRDAADQLDLRRATVHLAIYMLDIVMDSFNINEDKLPLIALTCLWIASKVEDPESQTPSIKDLNEIVNNKYNRREFVLAERKLLPTLGWYCLYPTAINFIECFFYKLSLQETRQSIGSGKRQWSADVEMFANTSSELYKFLDLLLRDRRFVNLTPSIMASACIAAARATSGIRPVWSDRFIKLTGYNESDIREYYESLIAFKLVLEQKDKNSNTAPTPESGYLTLSDSEDEFEYCNIYPKKRKTSQ